MAINMQTNSQRNNDLNGRRNRTAQPGFAESSGLPFVGAGEYLIEGDVYLDLADPARGPFRAMQWQCAGSKNRYVAAAQLPVARWDLLVRMTAYTSLANTTLWPNPASDLRN